MNDNTDDTIDADDGASSYSVDQDIADLQNEFIPYNRNTTGYYNGGQTNRTILSMIERVYAQSLTDQSARSETPAEIKVSLKSHQATLVAEMEARETSLRSGHICPDNSVLYSRYAILGDAVGAGKSLAVLAHIARMKQATLPTPAYYHKCSTPNLYSTWEANLRRTRTATLILVPHSLYRQWANYVKQQTTLKVAECKTKKFFADPAVATRTILESDAVLVPSTLYAELSNLTSTQGIYWTRVFVDEVDSIHIPATRDPFTADFTWLITATWQSCITPRYAYITANTLDYLVTRGEINLDTVHADFKANFLHTNLQRTEHTSRNPVVVDCNWTSVKFFAPFVNQHPHQDQLILRTTDAFRKMSLSLPAINTETIRCKSSLQHRIVHGLLSPEARQMLHAGDISGALAELGVPEETKMTLVDAVMNNQKRELQRLKQTLEFKQTLEYSTPALKASALENLQQKIASLETQISSFEARIQELDSDATCGICLDTPQNPACVPCCKHIMCAGCVLTHLTYKPTCPMCREPLTVRQLHRITDKKGGKKAKDASTEPELLKKSDALLKYISEHPDGRFIVFSRYDNPFASLIAELEAQHISVQEAKGNKDAIFSLINKFRAGAVRVLFLNSQHFASGMNLESATHVILYHGGIPPTEREQIIGRAQRLGRTTPLTVVQLLHDEEL
jgi:hypothetical protein